MIKNFDDLVNIAKEQETMKLVVAAANDVDVLKAVARAYKESIVEPILVGDENQIVAIANDISFDLTDIKIFNLSSLEDIALKSVSLVSSGEADFLMKGLIDTSVLLKAVLDKKDGLRTDSLLSHVMIYDVPAYHKLLFLTDGGMNIAPNLEQKKLIAKNSIQVAKAVGIENVKVACLAAKEKVYEKMPATVDAGALAEMAKKGEFGPSVTLEGPLALDLAISKEAAQVKNFDSKIAGDTDILLMPTIEMGNGVGKTLTYLSDAKSAGIIMGAKKPVVLVSRADSDEAKFNSIALGSVIAAN